MPGDPPDPGQLLNMECSTPYDKGAATQTSLHSNGMPPEPGLTKSRGQKSLWNTDVPALSALNAVLGEPTNTRLGLLTYLGPPASRDAAAAAANFGNPSQRRTDLRRTEKI